MAQYLIIFGMVIGFSILLGIVAVVWACCAAGKTADDAMEKWSQQ